MGLTSHRLHHPKALRRNPLGMVACATTPVWRTCLRFAFTWNFPTGYGVGDVGREMIQIELPYPDKILRPNSSKYWKEKMKAKASARELGRYLAISYYGKLKKEESLKLEIDFHFKDARRRDLDNLLASLKHHLDGVFIGLGVDDSQVNTIIMNKINKSNKLSILLTINKS